MCVVAPPASLAVVNLWESQKVSTHVTSHVRNLQLDQGTIVTPLGHLPSALCRLDGSSLLGMLAEANE